MALLTNIIVFVLVLGIIILIHEGGHLYFAKKAGILCHEYAIGMGPVLWQTKKDDTLYSIRAIPIGGFVSMAGEGVSDAMFKKGDTIALLFDETKKVKEIVLYEEGKYDVKGVVQSFDLYGKDMAPLYIEIDDQKYEVNRDAMYRFKEKQTMLITPEEKSFESKTLKQRFLTIFGGPLMNFILAFVIFFLVGFFIQKPNYDSNEIGDVSEHSLASSINLESGDKIITINGESIDDWYDLSSVMNDHNSTYINLSVEKSDGTILSFTDEVVATYIQTAGIVNFDEDFNYYSEEAIVGQSNGRAASAGLKSGDLITKVNDEVINNWDDLIAYFKVHTTGDVTISYERDGNSEETTYELISDADLEKLGSQNIIYQIGVTSSSQFNLGYSLLYAPREFGSNVAEVFTTIGLLFGGSSIGVSDLSGPVGIFQLVSQVKSNGFISLLVFMGFLSINIGILNLLPIPALDGGRLVFLGIEAVTKKPLNRKVENYANLIMFFILMGLILFVTFNDVFRLING